MGKCSFKHCENSRHKSRIDASKREVRWYVIPKVNTRLCHIRNDRSQRRQTLWIQAINRPDITPQNVQKGKQYFVCGAHFVNGAASPAWMDDSPNWVPTVNICPTSQSLGGISHESGKETSVLSSVANEVESSTESFSPNPSHPPHPLYSPVVQECGGESDTPQQDICNDSSFINSSLNSSASFMDVSGANPFVDLHGENVETRSECNSSLQPVNPSDSIPLVRIIQKDHKRTPSATQSLCDSLANAVADRLELEDKLKVSETKNRKILLRLISVAEQYYELIQNHHKLEKDSKSTINRLTELLNKKHTEKALHRRICNLVFFDIKVLESNDKKVAFYTGLPNFAVFNCVLKRCSSHIRNNQRRSLEPWQRLLLTLMRLRLSLLLQDLAYRFGISVSTAGLIFNEWISILYELLAPECIIWPSQETTDKVKPRQFREDWMELVRNKYKFLKTTLHVDMLQVKKHDDENLDALDKIVPVCWALTNLSPSMVHRGSLDEEEGEEEDKNIL